MHTEFRSGSEIAQIKLFELQTLWIDGGGSGASPSASKDAQSKETSMTVAKSVVMAPNAALSGRGPTTHQKTSKQLPAVRLNA